MRIISPRGTRGTSGGWQSKAERASREETITEWWRFQTRITSIPRPTSETAREGYVFFPP